MITIVIPTIGKTTLPRAVKSLINQSNPHWLAIVGGDGMNPLIDRPLGDYQNIYDDRVVYHEFDRSSNQSKTRHKIIDLVTTDWVGFLDDDDILLPEYVEHFMQLKDTCDILIFKMNNYGAVLPPSRDIRHGFVGISFAAKKHLFDSIQFPDPPSEDYNWLAMNRSAGVNIAYSEYIGYHVRPQSDV